MKHFSFRMAGKVRGITGPEDEFSAAKPEDGHSEQNKLSWCDLCYEDSGHKLKVEGFCQECNCFICKTCFDAHKKSPASKTHVILKGSRMPKSQDDKPVKYHNCSKHIGKINDYFCVDHAEMICSRCNETVHPLCNTKPIADLCKELASKDIDDFKEHVTDIHKSVATTKVGFENSITDMELQIKQVIKEIHNIRDQMVAKAEKLCAGMVSEVAQICNQKTTTMSQQLLQLSDLSQSLKETISDIDRTANSQLGPNLFVRIQDIVTNAKHFENEIAELDRELRKSEVSFSVNPEFLNFVSAAKPLGQVKEKSSRLGTLKTSPKLAFPALPETTIQSSRKQRNMAISQLRPKKLDALTIKTADDRKDCKAEGMDVTDHGIFVVSDIKNRKVKVFSPKYRFLSSVSLPGQPYDVTVLNDRTIVATVDQEKRFIIDITEPASIYVDNSLSFGYFVTGMTTYDGKLVVIRWNEPRCVKMISLDGQEIWSTMHDNTGQQLFKSPYSLATTEIEGQSTVLVTDWGKETLTFLNTSDGRFVKKVDLKGLGPRGLSIDGSGNIYVCCCKTAEIRVWSPDLSEERVILSRRELQPEPMDILYNDTTDELLVSYRTGDEVDRFQL